MKTTAIATITTADLKQIADAKRLRKDAQRWDCMKASAERAERIANAMMADDHRYGKAIRKLDAALDAAQTRCRARTITASDIVDALLHLHGIGIRGKGCKGVEVRVSPHAQHFPNAYRGIPECTRCTVAYDGCAWKITWIGRDRCDANSYVITAGREQAAEAVLAAAL